MQEAKNPAGPCARGIKTLLIAVVALVVFFSTAVPAMAQDPLCDVGLYDQMTQRARLQGQRETAMVENLVYKPDSILEYTCYTRFVDHIPPNIRYTSSFFEDANSDDVPDYTITNDFSTYPMLSLSRGPADTWVTANFSHTFLGGRVPADPAIVAAGANYVCDAMSVVWTLAKCQQFAPDNPEDGFYGLLEFTSASDIRRYPNACAGAVLTNFGTVPAAPAAVVFTSASALPTDCGVPVPTGQVITMPIDEHDPPGRPVTYNEKNCPNAACTYIPTALNAGNCVP